MSKVRQQELMVVGGFYEISSGIVDFFHEVNSSRAAVFYSCFLGFELDRVVL